MCLVRSLRLVVGLAIGRGCLLLKVLWKASLFYAWSFLCVVVAVECVKVLMGRSGELEGSV